MHYTSPFCCWKDKTSHEVQDSGVLILPKRTQNRKVSGQMASPAPAAGLRTIPGRHHHLSSPFLVSVLAFLPTQVTILPVSMVSPVMWSRLSPSVEEYHICSIPSWSRSFWMNVERDNNVALGKTRSVPSKCQLFQALFSDRNGKEPVCQIKGCPPWNRVPVNFLERICHIWPWGSYLVESWGDPRPSSSFQLMLSGARWVS